MEFVDHSKVTDTNPSLKAPHRIGSHNPVGMLRTFTR